MPDIYLSICIPTKGRLEILKNTLDSIYLDCKADFDDFEVVISDNSTDQLLPEMLKSYSHYPNIVYQHSTTEGFLNSFNALKISKGVFLKLHNDYTVFRKNALEEMIAFVKKEKQLKPLVFFSNNERKNNNIISFDSFDSFIYHLSFLNTWSTGFSIWKEDFEKHSKSTVNKIFPHTSLLLYQFDKDNFIINDKLLFDNQAVITKGGYNLFEAFGVQYLTMLKHSLEKGQITYKTFEHVKRDLFTNFLVPWYYNTMVAKNQYTFNLSNIRASINVYYSDKHYYRMIIHAYGRAIAAGLKRIIKSVRTN